MTPLQDQLILELSVEVCFGGSIFGAPLEPAKIVTRSTVARRGRTRRVGNDIEARQALEGAELAPGNRATLGAQH